MRSRSTALTFAVPAVAVLAMASAHAACVDLPDKLVMLASQGASVPGGEPMSAGGFESAIRRNLSE